MDTRLFWRVAALALATAFGQCNAALIANGYALDRGDYTTVTATGLDWLDVTLTQGQSYDAVLTSKWYVDGWMHASTAQVMSLFSAFDADWENGWSFNNVGLGSALAKYLGNTSTRADEVYVYGIMGDKDTGLPSKHFASIANDVAGQVLAYVQINNLSPLDTEEWVSIGHFLVRPTALVPEPRTAWLLGLGLAGLAWQRRARTASRGMVHAGNRSAYI